MPCHARYTPYGLPYHKDPKSAYSLALNILDYLATKFQYLAFPRLNYEPRSHENPSISLATNGPKRNRKS